MHTDDRAAGGDGTGPDTGFIVSYLLSKNPELETIEPDLDLIESRVLDSLGFVNFLYVLEEHTGREITLDQVSPEDFRTVDRIASRFLNDVTDGHD